jgi:hypothetical protein
MEDSDPYDWSIEAIVTLTHLSKDFLQPDVTKDTSRSAPNA